VDSSYRRSHRGPFPRSAARCGAVRRVLFAAAAVVLAALAAVPAAISTATAAAADTSSGGPTLRVESDTSFSTFNPFIAEDAGDQQVIDGIYPLLTLVGKNGVLEPYLATNWVTSPDRLTWTFTLRSGLKWSDGQPLTAKDVAWTYNLIMTNPEAGTVNGSLVANFASVTAPNASTVEIKTKSPQANVPYMGAQIPIVPEHVWASQVKNMANYGNHGPYPVVGYGPWTLTGYVANQYATLTANKGFYAGPPAYQTLIVQYYSNSDAAVAALRTGALDEIDDLTATQFESLKGKSGVGLYPTASNIWDAIEVNTGARTQSGQKFGDGNPILADPVVRKAISLAINRKELVSKVLDGLGIPGAGYWPPAYPQYWWTPPPSMYEGFDPTEANRILDAAGFRKGKDGIRVDPKTHKRLSFRLGIHSDEGSDAQIAPYVVEWLQDIGIKLTVQSMSYNQLNTALPKGDWDMLMDSWNTVTPDPTTLFSIQTCGQLPANETTPGGTDAFFCDPAYDKLFNEQSREFGQAQRTATVDQMQNILYQANVDIVLYYYDNLEAVRTADVKDYFYGAPNSQSFYPEQSDYLNWLGAKPLATASGGTSMGLVVGVPVAAVVVIGASGVYALRRRRTAGERE
jgi:ABC-type transport system substrate-binding protein